MYSVSHLVPISFNIPVVRTSVLVLGVLTSSVVRTWVSAPGVFTSPVVRASVFVPEGCTSYVLSIPFSFTIFVIRI